MEEQKQEGNRTPEEQFLGILPTTDDYNSPYYSSFLNNLTSLGDIRNKTYEVFEGISITLRLLLPIENLEVLKIVDRSPGDYSKGLTLKLETLARAIQQVNGHYLRFSDDDIAKWQAFRDTKEKPTEIDQQRHILQYSFKQMIVDEIFTKYEALVKEQYGAIETLKKKSKPTTS
jgi:hypothetical protein